MKVLHVIHGYPPYYMAGSEIYTYHLTKELSKYVDIFVFTRIENQFENSYIPFDEVTGRVRVRAINKPNRDYSLKDKYLDRKLDETFINFVKETRPDIVHIGHLSHLSTNIVNIAKEEFNLPVIFTIHDFWLYCLRGQMIDPLLNICEFPSDKSCFNCLKYHFKEILIDDINEYKEHMGRVIKNIDLFLSPSKFLKKFFENNGISNDNIIYSPYGFNKNAINYKNLVYTTHSKINFGFTGRIVPTKGIKILLKAFNKIDNYNAQLLIFGDTGAHEKYLKWYANEKVIFKGGYNHTEVNKVLQQIDILIVPSIWYENSPLVIQEAFLAGTPVIASSFGGMAEIVKDNINGLTFKVGNVDDLKNKMKIILEDPTILNKLKPNRDSVRSIEDDASNMLSLYRDLLKK